VDYEPDKSPAKNTGVFTPSKVKASMISLWFELTNPFMKQPTTPININVIKRLMLFGERNG